MGRWVWFSSNSADFDAIVDHPEQPPSSLHVVFGVSRLVFLVSLLFVLPGDENEYTLPAYGATQTTSFHSAVAQGSSTTQGSASLPSPRDTQSLKESLDNIQQSLSHNKSTLERLETTSHRIQEIVLPMPRLIADINNQLLSWPPASVSPAAPPAQPPPPPPPPLPLTSAAPAALPNPPASPTPSIDSSNDHKSRGGGFHQKLPRIWSRPRSAPPSRPRSVPPSRPPSPSRPLVRTASGSSLAKVI
jgi:hypothetical protein